VCVDGREKPAAEAACRALASRVDAFKLGMSVVQAALLPSKVAGSASLSPRLNRIGAVNVLKAPG
jgi:hypothetical protein